MLDNNFNRELKSILHYVLEYGIKHTSFKVDYGKLSKSKEKNVEFISNVHIGFMKAQNLIIQNLLQLGKKRDTIKKLIKELNKQKASKESLEKSKYNLKVIEYKESVLRKIADTIAWQLLGFDRTIIRRLYSFTSQVEIFNSNLKHDLKVVEEIFNSDKTTFPLVNDITSFIQVGDLLVRELDSPDIKLIELKEGKVNDEIAKIVEEYEEIPCDRRLHYQLEDKDEKFKKQFNRYVKQKSTALNKAKIINTGSGTDEVTGLNIQTVKETFYTEHFDEVVASMMKEVDKRNYSLRTIDGCLIVGVYNTSKMSIHTGFDMWKESVGIDFPTIDLRSSVSSPLSYPLFLHPFSINDKVKLINGEKVIYMSLDIDKWLKMFEDKEVNVNILSKKQTARFNTTQVHSKVFEHKGQAIEIEYKNVKQMLSDGIFERMFNQFLRPSSAIEFFKYGHDKVGAFLESPLV